MRKDKVCFFQIDMLVLQSVNELVLKEAIVPYIYISKCVSNLDSNLCIKKLLYMLFL